MQPALQEQFFKIKHISYVVIQNLKNKITILTDKPDEISSALTGPVPRRKVKVPKKFYSMHVVSGVEIHIIGKGSCLFNERFEGELLSRRVWNDNLNVYTPDAECEFWMALYLGLVRTRMIMDAETRRPLLRKLKERISSAIPRPKIPGWYHDIDAEVNV